VRLSRTDHRPKTIYPGEADEDVCNEALYRYRFTGAKSSAVSGFTKTSLEAVRNVSGQARAHPLRAVDYLQIPVIRCIVSRATRGVTSHITER
jgi:hypothetical protein